MYKKQNKKHLSAEYIKQLNQFTQHLNPHKYQIATAAIEYWYGTIFSIINMKNEYIFFHDQTELCIYTKAKNDKIQIKFLIDGTDIPTKAAANAIIGPINSWRLTTRKEKTGFSLQKNENSNIVGTHRKRKISIIKNQTLIYIPQIFQTRTQKGKKEQIYIKELIGTKIHPKNSKCPKRKKGQHNFTCWFSFKTTKYQACRYCKELWISTETQPRYTKLENAIWHITKKIKKGQAYPDWFLSLPGTDIWYDNQYDKYYYPKFYNNQTQEIITTINKKSIPSYPATSKQLEKQNEAN